MLARGQAGHARHHPIVRRGTLFLCGQWIGLAVVLIVLGVVVLVRGLTALPIFAALACFLGGGLSLWVGWWMVRNLRHEYRYEKEDPVPPGRS